MKTLFIVLFSIPFFLSAQIKVKYTDVFEELDSGLLTLRFFNAVTGIPLTGGMVEIDSIGSFETDEEGKMLFPAPTGNGLYRAVVRADGYIPTEFPVEIMAGTLFFNRISVSPKLDLKSVRIVLDWDKAPLDLDAHFQKSSGDGYHISYRNMKVLADGTGKLDIDAMQGYGPETITVNEISTASIYSYSVRDYSNRNANHSGALSESKGTVKVYADGRLLKVFQVPRKKEGTVWNVFTIEQGAIREVHQLTSN
ncbi:MAG: hypothetical protein WCW35_06885 [Bacteroidota bacterium]